MAKPHRCGDACEPYRWFDERLVLFVSHALIRIATAEDSLAIARVHVETWRDAYRGIVADKHLADLSVEVRAAKWLERLTADFEQRPLIFVAEDLGEVVGFVSGGATSQPGLPYDAELYGLYVKPDRQRQRFGRLLTRALVDELVERGFRGLVVGVLERNESGRRFYESIGSREVGRQSLVIGGDAHSEIFYGWTAIEDVLA